MVIAALHRLVARPAVYDLVQAAAGASFVRRRLRDLVPRMPAGSIVIDVGAGTGLYRNIWPASYRYICLDIDPLKLKGFRARHDDQAIEGDATRLPIASASADAVACTLMAHHLDDRQLDAMLCEIARVLKPSGMLLFADPLWRRQRLPGRMLWSLDRGAHPRESGVLQASIERNFQIGRWTEFAFWHRYAACVALKR